MTQEPSKIKVHVYVPMETMELVIRLRKVQKQYFATRDPSWLAKAKYLEQQVDRALVDVASDIQNLRAATEAIEPSQGSLL